MHNRTNDKRLTLLCKALIKLNLLVTKHDNAELESLSDNLRHNVAKI